MSAVDFARVGLRFHLVADEPMYAGQPQVGMCGAVFIRQDPRPDSAPACEDCARRDVERMRFEADQLLDRANAKAISLWSPATDEGGER